MFFKGERIYYTQLYPDHIPPHDKCSEVLSVFLLKYELKNNIISKNMEVETIAYFQGFHENSVQNIIRNSNSLQGSVLRTLGKYKFVPHKY